MIKNIEYWKQIVLYQQVSLSFSKKLIKVLNDVHYSDVSA